jgi:hypothetical protein
MDIQFRSRIIHIQCKSHPWHNQFDDSISMGFQFIYSEHEIKRQPQMGADLLG